MSHQVGSIANNTSEDFIDELSTGIVSKYSAYVFSGFDEDKLKTGNDDIMQEALDSAKQSLQFQITNIVTRIVVEYATTRLVLISGAIFTYVRASRVARRLSDGIANGLGGVPIVGRFLQGAVRTGTDLAIGNQTDRLAMAQMANNNANNISNIYAQERQTQTMQVSQNRSQMLDTMSLSTNQANNRRERNLQLYMNKMRMGTWTVSALDKNLYLSIIPREQIAQPFTWSQSFVDGLNSFSEFATDSENRIVNLAQSHVDLIATNGISRVQ
jgi:hypothetical protein